MNYGEWNGFETEGGAKLVCMFFVLFILKCNPVIKSFYSMHAILNYQHQTLPKTVQATAIDKIAFKEAPTR